MNALNYIEWGEKQKFKSGPQVGLTWTKGPTVSGRKPGWYAIPESTSQYAHLFINSAYGSRYINKFSIEPVIADKRLYYCKTEYWD